MKKKRALIVMGSIISLLFAYISWSFWPRPAQVEWHYRITQEDRVIAEDYISKRPPKRPPLTWPRIWSKISRPYDPPRQVVAVILMKYSDENEFIQLIYPERLVYLRHTVDGSWEEVDPSEATTDKASPYIGRMFEKRTK